MIFSVKKIKSSILRLNSVWQASLALLLFVVWVLSVLLEVPEHLEYAKNIIMSVSAALCTSNVLLYFWISYSRRRQLRRGESHFILSNFRDSDRFGDIFSDAFDFQSGAIMVKRAVPSFSFIRLAQSEDDILELSEINHAAFQGTNWSGSSEQKFQRNLRIWKKNPTSFMVLEQFDKSIIGDFYSNCVKNIIFFSCIVPLTENGFQRYFIDKISGDNEFRADWIAPADKKPHSLLLFTFARHPELAKTISENWRSKLIFMYLRCVAVHLQEFLKTHYADESEATVYFQNSGVPFRRLANCAKMDESSLRSRMVRLFSLRLLELPMEIFLPPFQVLVKH